MNKTRLFGALALLISACGSSSDEEVVIEEISPVIIEAEETNQAANETAFNVGTDYVLAVQQEIAFMQSNKEENAILKLEKLQRVASAMDAINKLNADIIIELDELKLKILNVAGENTAVIKMDDANTLVWRETKDGLPAKINCKALTTAGLKSDELSKASPSLLKNITYYQSSLCSAVGTYQSGDKMYQVNIKDVGTFSSDEELRKKVYDMLEGTNANLVEDREVLTEIYMQLTKIKLDEVNELNVIESLMKITSIQNTLLNVRNMALATWKARVYLSTENSSDLMNQNGTTNEKTANASAVKVKPVLYWGDVKAYGPAVKGSSKLEAKCDNNSGVSFEIVVWEFTAKNPVTKEPLFEGVRTGTGSNIASVRPMIIACRKGDIILFNCRVKGSDGVTRNVKGEWTV